MKNCLPVQETQVPSLGWKDPLEMEMATHSSILAWRIRGQRSLEGYSPWGHKRVGYNLATKQQQHLLRACCVPVTVWKCLLHMNSFTPHNPILQLRNAEAQGHLTADLY